VLHPTIRSQILKWDSWEDTFLGEQVFRVFFRHELERPVMNFQKLMTTVALFSSLGGTDVNVTKAKQSLAFKIYDQARISLTLQCSRQQPNVHPNGSSRVSSTISARFPVFSNRNFSKKPFLPCEFLTRRTATVSSIGVS
jgi:hypothetical protein